jgi:hypothetical protein
MAPIVHGLKSEYDDQMVFTFLDIDDPDTKAWMEELVYVGRPYYVLLDAEGNVLYKWSGAVAEEDLRAKFEEAISPNRP